MPCFLCDHRTENFSDSGFVLSLSFLSPCYSSSLSPTSPTTSPPVCGCPPLGHHHLCFSVESLHTAVSGWKAIVGLRKPVTIGIHISTEILKTSYLRHLKILITFLKYQVAQDGRAKNCQTCTKHSKTFIFLTANADRRAVSFTLPE